jgi:hypothetical protein
MEFNLCRTARGSGEGKASLRSEFLRVETKEKYEQTIGIDIQQIWQSPDLLYSRPSLDSVEAFENVAGLQAENYGPTVGTGSWRRGL